MRTAAGKPALSVTPTYCCNSVIPWLPLNHPVHAYERPFVWPDVLHAQFTGEVELTTRTCPSGVVLGEMQGTC